MEESIQQNSINSNSNNSNNTNKNLVFQTVKYINNKEIKFDEYYKFDVNYKAFYCNLCDNFK